MKNRIVIIDSAAKSRRLLENTITAGGYTVLGASSIGEGLSLLAVNSPDIVLIDPEASFKETVSFIKRSKQWSKYRIIVISSAIPEKQRIELLDSGADDYIEKPLNHGELLARIRVQLRLIEELNKARGMNPENSFSLGGLCVDFKLCRVTVDGEEIHLTKNEFMILSLLCRYPDRVLTYSFIMESVWGPQITEGTGILRVNIANIRRKLESGGKKFIFTENGIGYRIICEK